MVDKNHRSSKKSERGDGFLGFWQAAGRLARAVGRMSRSATGAEHVRTEELQCEIELLHPVRDSVTEPLQAHDWSGAAGEPHGSLPSGPLDWRNLQFLSQDRTTPRAVEFAWKKPETPRGALRYDLIVSQRPDLGNAWVKRHLTRPRAELCHLHIATDYYWQVVAHQDGDVVARSAVWRFRTHASTPRWIHVPEITNVRDLGGWPLPGGCVIRQGLVYRSSEMNGHLHLTAEGRHILENELKIRTDLDLRGFVDDARPALDPDKVQWIHIPISPYECISDEVFTNAYREIFQLFADRSNYPILFHCVGGADRGGTIAFLLGGLLGKSMDNLIRDYELTSLSIWGLRSHASMEFQGMLSALCRYGEPGDSTQQQIERYLLSIGITPHDIESIRGILVAERDLPGRR
jgi:hypothetical protein